MRKGVSPVVAVVLLIAISVIAAVGVWYWVGGMANKPPGVTTILRSIQVTDCNITTSPVIYTTVFVRNNGRLKADRAADIYNADTYVYVGQIMINSTNPVNVSSVSWVLMGNSTGGTNQTTLVTGGRYVIKDGDYPEVQFGC